MIHRLLADAVLALHVVFVLFVALGGILVLRRPWLAWIHVPAAAWGAAVELAGWVCPLTPLEKHLRSRAGGVGYEGGFIEHYLLPVLYPGGLTREIQIGLGLLVLAINGAVYARLVYRSRTESGGSPG